ncbi:MAG: penicillin-insensitive murein endopeptidase [Candidatus Competibacteraceae bacterium]
MIRFVIALLLALEITSSYAADLWSNIRNPLPASPQVIGFYSAGCFAGGVALPLKGPGFQVMRPSRNRYYGHPELVSFVTRMGPVCRVAQRPDTIVICPNRAA